MSDFWIVRQVVRQTSCMDFCPCHQKRDTSVALGTPNVTLKISRKWRMSSEQRIQLGLPTIRGKLFPNYIYICLEHNKSTNEEILL